MSGDPAPPRSPVDNATRPLAVADYPALFQAADQQSLEGQRTYRNLTGLELALVVGGSLFGVAAAVLSASWQIAAVVATVSFVGALITRIVIRLRGDDSGWFDGRAVAESVKTQTWRYMMRAPPFAEDGHADRAFASEMTDILYARPSVQASFASQPMQRSQITSRMREERARSLPDRLRLYAEQRLAEQAEWYRSAGNRHRAVTRRWSAAALAAEAVAIVIAVLMVNFKPLADIGLLGLFGALAAAFSAWAQLGRHSELSRAYGLAYQELLALLSLVDEIDSEELLTELVDDGEGAISREHTMWVARRADPLGRLREKRAAGS